MKEYCYLNVEEVANGEVVITGWELGKWVSVHDGIIYAVIAQSEAGEYYPYRLHPKGEERIEYEYRTDEYFMKVNLFDE